MMSNYCYIACAGSGKSTQIINCAIEAFQKSIDHKKILVITFTTNNQNNLKSRIINRLGYLPEKIVIVGWYHFLLTYWIKPYKGDVISKLYNEHIGLLLTNGHSGTKRDASGRVYTTFAKGDLESKYLTTDNLIYSDRASEFAIECYKKNAINLINRLNTIFSHIYIDEAQDLVGADFDILKIILTRSEIFTTILADPRQHTYSTHAHHKYKNYAGRPDYFAKEKINNKRKTYININYTHLKTSHRCNNRICIAASNLIPEYEAMEPCTCDSCHITDSYNKRAGCFLVKESYLEEFIAEYSPLALTDDKTVTVSNSISERMNFGECKGLERDTVLIYPTDPYRKWIKNKTTIQSYEAKSKFYVALTRARHTVGIVVPDDFQTSNKDFPFWKEELTLFSDWD